MSKWGAVFASLLMSSGMLSVATMPTAEAQAADAVCGKKAMRAEISFEDGVIHPLIHYRKCVPSEGPAWVVPLNTVGMYNMDGTHMSCDWFLRKFDGVKFNWYMWDKSGRNFNPPKYIVPCDESTTNSKIQKYNNAPRLFFGPGHGPDAQPRWKVNVTVQYNARKDAEFSRWKRFKLQ